MKSEDFKDSPVVWFTTMEIEAGRGNFERAAEAKQQLERLGVFVRFKGKVQRQYKKAEWALARRRRTILGGDHETA